MRYAKLAKVFDSLDDAVEDLGEPPYTLERGVTVEPVPILPDAPGGFVEFKTRLERRNLDFLVKDPSGKDVPLREKLTDDAYFEVNNWPELSRLARYRATDGVPPSDEIVQIDV